MGHACGTKLSKLRTHPPVLKKHLPLRMGKVQDQIVLKSTYHYSRDFENNRAVIHGINENLQRIHRRMSNPSL